MLGYGLQLNLNLWRLCLKIKSWQLLLKSGRWRLQKANKSEYKCSPYTIDNWWFMNKAAWIKVCLRKV